VAETDDEPGQEEDEDKDKVEWWGDLSAGTPLRQLPRVFDAFWQSFGTVWTDHKTEISDDVTVRQGPGNQLRYDWLGGFEMHFSEILPQILVWGLIALLWMECVPAAPCELA
jgi:hypothetical protein